LLLSACGPRPAAVAVDPNNAVLVQQGQPLYQTHCARCHGANLEGQPDWRIRKPDGRLPAPPHDDSGHSWHHPTAMLVEIVKLGLVPPNAPEGYASDMPAFKNILDDAQIAAVLSFIQSRWGEQTRSFRRDNKMDVPG
jgi:mono/diheme cytochrome c family protein